MATIAVRLRTADQQDRFFGHLAIAMALTVVVGFSTQLIAGRSSFHVRPLIHLHAVAFMGWVMLFTIQAQIGVRGATPSLHRRLGWIGAGWAVALVLLGCALTVDVTRRANVPFFFHPQIFLIANPATVFAFFGFTVAAIRMRRRTDWHRRLHLCGMTMIMGPALGRLLPLPFLTPWAFEWGSGSPAVFLLAGMVHDRRRLGRVHPAWLWGAAVLAAVLVGARLIAFSPAGDAIYRAVTADAPGAAVPGRLLGSPPSGLRGPAQAAI
ncbi:hypothetical protein [uncultured Sphingomonas sp.]|uniref:hypothetical protein n=1 Tax=uncultured Sphingomonas sp. TaxID=158754 RepID=UPI0035C9AA8C